MKTISVVCCLLHATWTLGESIGVEGFESGEVSFPCSHKLAWQNDKYLCKHPCKAHKDKLATVQSGQTVQSGRMTLKDSGKGDFTVTFRQLQLSDSGMYWCGVDRTGFDTFTEVHINVKKVPQTTPTETATVPGLSPTSENVSSPTSLKTAIDTSVPTNLSTATNCTNGGEQSISTGTALFATISAVSALVLLILVVCLRKHANIFKALPQVCSNHREVVGADDGERLKRFPPTSAPSETDFSESVHIYENVRRSKAAPSSKCSAANVQNKHEISSESYISCVPAAPPERTSSGARGKGQNKTTPTRQTMDKPTKSSCDAARHSRCADSRKERPRSLWFGLDLSGL
ncbi:uncharacterized protein V6R79_003919 [Siganus canaliculatus]